MMKRALATVCLAAAVVATAAGAAQACPRDTAIAGVVQRVSGQRGDVYIERAGAERIRPAPMESLCEGDVVVATATGASITMRLDGAAASTLLQGPGRLVLPTGGRRANVVDNALSLLIETWMPDIKRTSNFGVVRGRSGEPPRWAVPGLEEGYATVRRGERPLLVRWDGDNAAYRVEVVRADGVVIEKARAFRPEVRLSNRTWSGGPYTIRVFEGAGKTPALQGRFRAGDAPPANPTPFPASTGEEIRAAAEALRLVQLDADRWSFEAIQIIDRAPQQGLDRDALYRTIGNRAGEVAAVAN